VKPKADKQEKSQARQNQVKKEKVAGSNRAEAQEGKKS
jgi:hypothetical protein